MNNFRTIRFALTVSLIGTMLTQSVVAIAVSVGCGDLGCKQSVASACEGCGCCEVSEPGQSCCCCGESAKTEPKSLVRGCEPIAQPSVSGGALTQVVQGVCLCGISGPPMDRGASAEHCAKRNQFRVAFAPEHLELQESLRQRSGHSHSSVESGDIPRFSQRLLCVWRI